MSFIDSEMAYVIWNNLPDRSWTALYRAFGLNDQIQKSIGEDLSFQLANIVEYIDITKLDFPQTQDDLQEFLNQKLLE